MTKQEAIIELKKGNKVTHRLFSEGEFMYQNGDTYVFEDSVKCHPVVFWQDRASEEWENNWSLCEKKCLKI